MTSIFIYLSSIFTARLIEGERGPARPKGFQGSDGRVGELGRAGERGATGREGRRCENGPDGDRGFPGPRGDSCAGGLGGGDEKGPGPQPVRIGVEGEVRLSRRRAKG